MPEPAINYVTNDNTRWGSGLGRKLHADEIDRNMWELANAIVALQGDRPQPNNIASISIDGTAMSITLDDGTVLGPFPLPVLLQRWRGAWTAFTDYAVLDTFAVEGFGLYTVVKPFTSGANFDESVQVDGEPALLKNLGADGGGIGAAAIYDMGLFFSGRLQDVVGTALYAFVADRAIVIPTAGAHQARLIGSPPATVLQQMNVKVNGTVIGTITFLVGQDVGAVAISADATVNAGDVLIITPPAAADGTAAGLSVTFAAQRVI
jgi:hypothetical protein